jgi:hypothetical protein
MRKLVYVALVATLVAACSDDQESPAVMSNNGANNGNNGSNNGANNGANNGVNNGENNGANNGAVDEVEPTVGFASPAADSEVAGEVEIRVEASDEVGVQSVTVTVDGSVLGTADTEPYVFIWEATEPGEHALVATASDAAGNEGTATITVTVPETDEPPTVEIVAPAEGAVLSGTVEIRAEPADDDAVVGVRFLVDGGLLADDDTVPYVVEIDATEFSEGEHSIEVIATDTADQPGSATRTVVFDHTGPEVAITSPTGEGSESPTVTVAATATDEHEISQTGYSVDDGGDIAFEGDALEATVEDLAAGEHTLTVFAVDVAGNRGEASVVFTVDTPPTIAFVAPVQDEVVTGAYEVRVDADDDVEVASVTLYDGETELGAVVDGVYAWRPSFEEAAHDLRAVATDTLGQTAQATVTVNVDHPLGFVAVVCETQQPCAPFVDDLEVRGDGRLVAEVVDDGDDVVTVTMAIDGELVAEVAQAPYELTLSLEEIEHGVHTVLVTAVDSDGEEYSLEASLYFNRCDLDGDRFLSDRQGCGGLDCDDGDRDIHPEADDVCDGVNNDCDANVDEGFPEVCDGVDNNCDEGIDVDLDVECPVGRVCRGGICERAVARCDDLGIPCDENTLDGDGLTCIAADNRNPDVRTCQFTCQFEEDCPEGSQCQFIDGDVNNPAACFPGNCDDPFDPNACDGLGEFGGTCTPFGNGTFYCSEAGELGVGEICQTNDQCGPGSFCSGFRCQAICTRDSDDAPCGDGLSCRDVGFDEVNVGLCGAECEGLFDDACGDGDWCFPLDEGGLCIAEGEQLIGQECEDIQDCVAEAICTRISDQVPDTCHPVCDPQGDDCLDGERCLALNGDIGACFPACLGLFDTETCGQDAWCFPDDEGGLCIPAGEGEVGDACEDLNDCAERSVCTRITDAVETTCTGACDADGEGCLDGETCLALNENIGACFGGCEPFGDGNDCPDDLPRCLPIDDGGPLPERGICFVGGRLPVGTACSREEGVSPFEQCAPTAVCTPGDDPDTGVCSTLCSPWAPLYDEDSGCADGEVCEFFSVTYGYCSDNVSQPPIEPFEPCPESGVWCSDAVSCLQVDQQGNNLCIPYCRLELGDSDCPADSECGDGFFEDDILGLCLPVQ